MTDPKKYQNNSPAAVAVRNALTASQKAVEQVNALSGQLPAEAVKEILETLGEITKAVGNVGEKVADLQDSQALIQKDFLDLELLVKEKLGG